jgi:hypothetical protein
MDPDRSNKNTYSPFTWSISVSKVAFGVASSGTDSAIDSGENFGINEMMQECELSVLPPTITGSSKDSVENRNVKSPDGIYD